LYFLIELIYRRLQNKFRFKIITYMDILNVQKHNITGLVILSMATDLLVIVLLLIQISMQCKAIEIYTAYASSSLYSLTL